MHGNDAARRFYERCGYTPFVHMDYHKLAVD
jgi:GNAT superfamily N-acetyltransferase